MYTPERFESFPFGKCVFEKPVCAGCSSFSNVSIPTAVSRSADLGPLPARSVIFIRTVYAPATDGQSFAASADQPKRQSAVAECDVPAT